MPRNRTSSVTSLASSLSSKSTTTVTATAADDQELGTMYDYLAKIILLGPSGCGKSCLLHRFVRGEWKVLTSQTIGVEFSSKIVRVGTGPRSKRIKLQLWDTAGQERFRSVTRSYYRGATGALLVYDISKHSTFTTLPTFLSDARALASSNLTLILVGNKSDLVSGNNTNTHHMNTLAYRTNSGNNSNSNDNSNTHERYHRRNGTNSTIESVSTNYGGGSSVGTTAGASTSFGSVASTFSTSRFDTGSKQIPTIPPPPPPPQPRSSDLLNLGNDPPSNQLHQGTSTTPSIYSISTSSTGSTTSLANTITPNTYAPITTAPLSLQAQHHQPSHARKHSNPQSLISIDRSNNGSELITLSGSRQSENSSKPSSSAFPAAHLPSHSQPLHDRPVLPEEAHHFAITQSIPYTITTSALTGENVDEVFNRLARMILTKIELGEVDPDQPGSGIQYGDFHTISGSGNYQNGGSGYQGGAPSGRMDIGIEDGRVSGRRRGVFGGGGGSSGNREEWEEIFAGTGGERGSRKTGRKGGCCWS